MCGVCVRVSLEEFTEKQLLLGRGLKVRGGKETFFFTYDSSWIFSHVYVLTPLHTHSGKKWGRCFRAEKSNLSSTWEVLGTCLCVLSSCYHSLGSGFVLIGSRCTQVTFRRPWQLPYSLSYCLGQRIVTTAGLWSVPLGLWAPPSPLYLPVRWPRRESIHSSSGCELPLCSLGPPQAEGLCVGGWWCQSSSPEFRLTLVCSVLLQECDGCKISRSIS